LFSNVHKTQKTTGIIHEAYRVKLFLHAHVLFIASKFIFWWKAWATSPSCLRYSSVFRKEFEEEKGSALQLLFFKNVIASW